MSKNKTIKQLQSKLSAIIDYCRDSDIQVAIVAYNGKEVYTATHGCANDLSKAFALCDNKHIKDMAKLATIRAMIDEENGIVEDKQLNFN